MTYKLKVNTANDYSTFSSVYLLLIHKCEKIRKRRPIHKCLGYARVFAGIKRYARVFTSVKGMRTRVLKNLGVRAFSKIRRWVHKSLE